MSTWSSTDTLSDVGLLSTGENVQEVVSRVVTFLTHIACSGARACKQLGLSSGHEYYL